MRVPLFDCIAIATETCRVDLKRGVVFVKLIDEIILTKGISVDCFCITRHMGADEEFPEPIGSLLEAIGKLDEADTKVVGQMSPEGEYRCVSCR